MRRMRPHAKAGFLKRVDRPAREALVTREKRFLAFLQAPSAELAFGDVAGW
jgi:hypothetical protein